MKKVTDLLKNDMIFLDKGYAFKGKKVTFQQNSFYILFAVLETSLRGESLTLHNIMKNSAIVSNAYRNSERVKIAEGIICLAENGVLREPGNDFFSTRKEDLKDAVDDVFNNPMCKEKAFTVPFIRSKSFLSELEEAKKPWKNVISKKVFIFGNDICKIFTLKEKPEIGMLILLYLACKLNEEDYHSRCGVSTTKICKDINISANTLKKYAKELESLGIVRTVAFSERKMYVCLNEKYEKFAEDYNNFLNFCPFADEESKRRIRDFQRAKIEELEKERAAKIKEIFGTSCASSNVYAYDEAEEDVDLDIDGNPKNPNLHYDKKGKVIIDKAFFNERRRRLNEYSGPGAFWDDIRDENLPDPDEFIERCEREIAEEKEERERKAKKARSSGKTLIDINKSNRDNEGNDNEDNVDDEDNGDDDY